jgi:PhzF family phenazine biosynthesis protein
MPALKIYQVDAFTSEVFRGNPAAICPLKEWLPDDVMQKIAAENNLSETAFYIPEKQGFHIRWFTPSTEVELCGHATLASAHVLFKHEGYSGEEIIFRCKIGILKVTKTGKLITLDFPSAPVGHSTVSSSLTTALGKRPLEYYTSGSFGMAVFASEKEVLEMNPDFIAFKSLEEPIIIVTAKGENCDFVSRVFGPKVGIDEDPVTGSAHTRLIPYWSGKLNKKKLTAIQVSERRGYLQCEDLGERVLMSGEAVTYLVGEIFV